MLKTLERNIRYALTDLLKWFFRNEKLKLKINPKRAVKILLIRNDAIGDMITTLPMVRFLKQMNSKNQIHVLASTRNCKIAQECEYIDKVYISDNSLLLPLQMLRSLRNEKYDVIFLCIFFKATLRGLMMNLIGSPKTIKATTERGAKYDAYFNIQSTTAWRKPSYWQRVCYLIPEVFDVDFTDKDIVPFLPIPTDSEQKCLRNLQSIQVQKGNYIVLNISTQQIHNEWSLEGFKDVCSHINKNYNVAVVLIGLPKDESSALAIASFASVILYPPTKDILEIAALIKHSSLLITPDTGVVHMAATSNTPSLILYIQGTNAKTEWGPFGLTHSEFVESKDLNWINTIPSQSVVEALDRIATKLSLPRCE